MKEETSTPYTATNWENCRHERTRGAGTQCGKKRVQCLFCGKRMTIGSRWYPKLPFDTCVKIGKLALTGVGYRRAARILGVDPRSIKTAAIKIKKLLA